jgi:predicted RNase H-like HicB family nuclease
LASEEEDSGFDEPHRDEFFWIRHAPTPPGFSESVLSVAFLSSESVMHGIRLAEGHAKSIISAMKQVTLPIVIEADADGYFVSCPALQGCYSQGDTYEEAMKNIQDAIRLHIEDRLADGEEIPEHVSVTLSTVEVAV